MNRFSRPGAIVVGLAHHLLRFALPSIVLVVLLHKVPLIRNLEAASFDLRLRLEAMLRPVPQDPDLVLLGIDDQNLVDYGRWPWPRQIWADVVDSLVELHVRAIFLDIAFPEPAETFSQLGGLSFEDNLRIAIDSIRQTMVGSRPAAVPTTAQAPSSSSHTRSVDLETALGHLEMEIKTHMPPPDLMFGESLAAARQAGVITAGVMTIEGLGSTPMGGPDYRLSLCKRWFRDHPDRPLDKIDPALLGGMNGRDGELSLYCSLYGMLRDNPTLDPRTSFTDSRLQPYAEIHASEVRRQAIEDLVDQAIDAMPPASQDSRDDIRHSGGLKALKNLGPLLDRVVDRVMSRRLTMRRHAVRVSGEENLSRVAWGETVRPPALAIARELDVIGADNSVNERDGSLRSIPVVWHTHQGWIPSASLALLSSLMSDRASDPENVRIEPGPTLVLTGKGQSADSPACRVPLTEDGRCLIHWVGDFGKTFTKMSLGPILNYASLRRERELFFLKQLRGIEYRQALLYRELARSLSIKDPARSLNLETLTSLLQKQWPAFPIQDNLYTDSDLPSRPGTRSEPRTVREWVKFFREAQADLEQSWKDSTEFLLTRVGSIKDPAERRARQDKYREMISSYRRFGIEQEALGRKLRGMLANKVCLIGEVASSSTDLTLMPFSRAYPKVGMWLNLMNTLVQRRFLQRPPLLAWNAGNLVDPDSMELPLVIAVAVVMALILPAMPGAGGALFGVMFLLLWSALCLALFLWWGLWIDMASPIHTTAVTYLLVYTWRTRRTERIRSMFETYVDPRIVSVIVEDESRWTELGGVENNITAFFSDIANFTSLSEKLTAHEVSEMLTDYLSPMTEIILEHEGTRDKYIGDAIVAFFGAPVKTTDHPLQACLTAIQQQRMLVSLKDEWRRDQKPWLRKILRHGFDLKFRVGLNSGQAKVGNFGSHRSKNYTMIGDTVNLASRLEGANKEYGTLIMASESTIAGCRERIVARELDRLVVKGKVEPVKVFEILGEPGSVHSGVEQMLKVYLEALDLYRRREFARARGLFEQALGIVHSDGPSRVYLDRCDVYLKEPPPDDWDGSFVMTHK